MNEVSSYENNELNNNNIEEYGCKDIKSFEGMSISDSKEFWDNQFVPLVESTDKNDYKEYSTYNEMKDDTGKTKQEINNEKPPHSNNLGKWFDNGGKIGIEDVDGKKVWTFIDAEDRAVKYIDGCPEFPDKAKHPVIGDISIGEFTGDRVLDKTLYLEKLENEYGLTEIPEGYSLHHDSKNGVLQLIKTEWHDEFRHQGGHSIYKEAE